jgi:hypothetical protein
MADDSREKEGRALRVLFCFGVTQSFFEAEPDSVPRIAAAITEAFADLGGRFGVRVLGTMDDDELQVGASVVWPWTAYVLADVPDIETVAKVTNVLREAEVDGARLWRYLRVEARVGRPLFFGND